MGMVVGKRSMSQKRKKKKKTERNVAGEGGFLSGRRKIQKPKKRCSRIEMQTKKQKKIEKRN
jgi:hypothetical protein